MQGVDEDPISESELADSLGDAQNEVIKDPVEQQQDHPEPVPEFNFARMQSPPYQAPIQDEASAYDDAEEDPSQF